MRDQGCIIDPEHANLNRPTMTAGQQSRRSLRLDYDAAVMRHDGYERAFCDEQ
jgi:hypothetical protein